MVAERALPSLLHLFHTSGVSSTAPQHSPTLLCYNEGKASISAWSCGSQSAAGSDSARQSAGIAKCRLPINQTEQQQTPHTPGGCPESAAKVSRVRCGMGKTKGLCSLQAGPVGPYTRDHVRHRPHLSHVLPTLQACSLLPLSARYAVVGPAGCDVKPLFKDDRLPDTLSNCKSKPGMCVKQTSRYISTALTSQQPRGKGAFVKPDKRWKLQVYTHAVQLAGQAGLHSPCMPDRCW
jgi:hypothetical protein